MSGSISRSCHLQDVQRRHRMKVPIKPWRHCRSLNWWLARLTVRLGCARPRCDLHIFHTQSGTRLVYRWLCHLRQERM